MKKAVGLGIVTAVLLTTGIGAQGKNFSGSWVVDTAKTAESGGATGGTMVAAGGGGGAMRSGGGVAVGGVATGGTMVATGGGGGAVRASGGGGRGGGGAATTPQPMGITVDAKTFSIQNGETVTSYPLDGSVKDMSNELRSASAKASWKGDKVVIETTTTGPNGPVITTASWYLEGEWLVRENTSTALDGSAVSRKTYYKKG